MIPYEQHRYEGGEYAFWYVVSKANVPPSCQRPYEGEV